MREAVGQKYIPLTGLCVPISDTAQLNRTFLRSLNAGKFDCFIADQTLAFYYGTTTDDAVFSIGFEPGDKKYFLVCQFIGKQYGKNALNGAGWRGFEIRVSG